MLIDSTVVRKMMVESALNVWKYYCDQDVPEKLRAELTSVIQLHVNNVTFNQYAKIAEAYNLRMQENEEG